MVHRSCASSPCTIFSRNNFPGVLKLRMALNFALGALGGDQYHRVE
jgi:hypothetical protein